MLKLLKLAAPLLTTVVAKVARAEGPAAKARAAGASGGLTAVAAWPLAQAFIDGVMAGAVPELRQAGAAIGAAAIGYLVNRVVTWLSPANAGPPVK